MERKFTVDEIEKIFNEIVVNSDRHGNSYYTTLDGETHTADTGYFEQCMPYFLKDLRDIANGIQYPKKRLMTLAEAISDAENSDDLLRKIIATNIYSKSTKDSNYFEYETGVHNDSGSISFDDIRAYFKKYLSCPISNYYFLAINGSRECILNFNIIKCD